MVRLKKLENVVRCRIHVRKEQEIAMTMMNAKEISFVAKIIVDIASHGHLLIVVQRRMKMTLLQKNRKLKQVYCNTVFSLLNFFNVTNFQAECRTNVIF